MKYLALILFIFPLALFSQNVGINTTDPTAILHIKSQLDTFQVVNEDFEDGSMAPAMNGLGFDTDTNDWFVSTGQANSGTVSLQFPINHPSVNPQNFYYPIAIPNGKPVKISFSLYKGSNAENAGFFRVSFLETTAPLFDISLSDIPNDSWTNYEILLENRFNSSNLWFAAWLSSGNAYQFYIDDIHVEYIDGHALRIEDENVSDGDLLTTDGLGNAHWADLRDGFYADSSSTNELQSLSLSSGQLSLSDGGGTVNLNSIDNQTLSFSSEGSLTISQGNTVEIDQLRNSTARAYLNSNNSLVWGQSNSATGANSAVWGDFCKANGINSASWGDFCQANGMNSTSWGDRCNANGDYSTAYGFDSDANGEKSIAIGTDLLVDSYGEIVLGRYNEDSDGNDSMWVDTDPLFIVGNGSSIANRKNAITLLKNGNMGIRQENPQYILDILGNSNSKMRYKSSTGSAGIIIDGGTIGNHAIELREAGAFKASFGWDSTNERMFFYQAGTNVMYLNNGRVGIRDSDPTYALELPNNSTVGVGRARAQAWITYSDQRVKKNGKELKYGLQEIMGLSPKSYEQHSHHFENGTLILDPESENTIGLYAQEVYDIIPEAVSKPENENEDLWSMDYEKLIPVLIQGMQEQQEIIENLKAKVQSLEMAQAKLAGQ